MKKKCICILWEIKKQLKITYKILEYIHIKLSHAKFKLHFERKFYSCPQNQSSQLKI